MNSVLDTVEGQRGEEIGIIFYSEGLYTKKKINYLDQLVPKGNGI